MYYRPFKVILKDCTSYSNIRSYYETSKPQIKAEDLPSVDEIVSMGLPINGLFYYVIEFQSSILFRDLFLSQRDILGAWAVSNRVAKIDSNSTPLSEEVLYLNEELRKMSEYNIQGVWNNIAKGALQEYEKAHLPLMSSTKFTVGIDLRTLVNFLYTLEVHNKKYFDMVGVEIIKSLSLEDIYKNHPKRDKYNELAISDLDRKSGKLGSMNLIYKRGVSMNLLAQIVRKNIIVKSQLWNYIEENPDYIFSGNCDEDLEVALYLTDDNLHSLQSTRCCWFAMMDKSNDNSWDYILSDIIKDKSATQFLSDLPCHGCGKNCVILGDMMSRVDRIDSHFYPCPLILEDSSVIEERVARYDSDSTIMNKWSESEDLIPFNPMNKYYRRYRG